MRLSSWKLSIGAAIAMLHMHAMSADVTGIPVQFL